MNSRTKALFATLVILIVVLAVQLGIQLRAMQPESEFSRAARRDEQAIERIRWIAQDQRFEWRNQFLGVPLHQYPNDLVIYQGLLFAYKPDVVIEAGTADGGLTVFLAMLLENINDGGRVLSIDIREHNGQQVLTSPNIRQSLKDRIRFFQGSSTNPAIVGEIAAIAKGKKVIVILDSDHSREHVRRELELYSALISPGGFIAVNDTHLSWLKGTQWLRKGDSGPGPALEDFLQKHLDFRRFGPVPDFMVSCMLGGIAQRR